MAKLAALKYKQTVALTVLTSAVLSLLGCDSQNQSQQQVTVSELTQMPVSSSKLVMANTEQVSRTLQNGLYLTATGQAGACRDCQFITFNSDARADNSSSAEYSKTTTQEQGVDESDRVKYDGNIMYLASNNDTGVGVFNDDNESKAPYVRVLARESDDSLTELSTIVADKSAGYLSELYLHQNVLAMIYDSYQGDGQGSEGIARTDIGFFPYLNKLGINFQNVEQAQSPALLSKLTMDGQLLSSRRIDNKIYLVSRYTPQLPEQFRVPEQATDSQLQAFYQQLVDTNVEQFLPKVYYSNGTSAPLVSADNCYLPQQHSPYHGYTSITTVTAFDLSAPEKFSSTCVLAPLDGFYSSGSNMYLYEKQYQQQSQSYRTVIHKFGYQQDGVKYQATGSVAGHVSWHNAHLRFSEKDDVLRVVTSSQNNDDNRTRLHRLFVLQQQQQQLQVVAQLPNEAQPAAIGKPDEDIYAVRYFADKAYIVTFRTTDPLYVVNLADNSAPFIEGELEIPGYSGYLQPINERFVLGIGQQIDPNSANGPVSEPSSPFIQGAKAELYDVTNPSSPKVAASLVYPEVYSAAQWDYRALTQLQVNADTYKFAFPLGGWSKLETADGQTQWNYKQAMQLVELKLTDGGSLTNIGQLSPKSEYYGQWGDRSVLHNDLVFYIRNNQVWQSYWSQPSLVTGPY